MSLINLSAYELNDAIRKKEVSVLDIAEAYLQRIEKVEDKINAFITFDRDLFLSRAKEIDGYIKEGNEVFDFTGIPIAIKDNICTKDIRTTCASKILANYISVYDATVIKKLNRQHFLMVGKANMDEFAMGSSNENSAFGPVRNPWNLDCVPGGSSGGPAASVAAMEAVCSLGSDTGGSIRQPASLCGIVGIKPTYGMVSRYGLVAFASSLDQIGPLSKNVRDCAALLEIISGYDECDSTSIKADIPKYTSFLNSDIKGMKIGVPKELMVREIDSEVRDLIYKVLRMLEKSGALIEEVSLPNLEYALSVYYIIAPSEASSNLSRFDGVRYGYRNMESATLREMYKKTRAEGFGAEVKRRIMIGTYCLSSGYYDAYYEKAQKVRTLIINDFKKAFSNYDVLISPTSPTTAFKIGDKADDPLMMYLSDICTIPVNLAGIPAISLPAGISKNNLPVGIQVIGDILREDNILKIAGAIERDVKWKISPKI
ncbi:MAG: Asp-tRNA(Asn)/Glu-tRNA(Gln) amidotransferase subunit GatA [Actinobacteria bacterium]|nr:Asp-tRNA(Asn)/Glu-tRNA(Gln) amidotransferase subunit GatA [Actinomycetota bacterium]